MAWCRTYPLCVPEPWFRAVCPLYCSLRYVVRGQIGVRFSPCVALVPHPLRVAFCHRVWVRDLGAGGHTLEYGFGLVAAHRFRLRCADGTAAAPARQGGARHVAVVYRAMPRGSPICVSVLPPSHNCTNRTCANPPCVHMGSWGAANSLPLLSVHPGLRAFRPVSSRLHLLGVIDDHTSKY